ncbi:hypothetical protein AAFF_G00138480 [Aldrovandia affinis]|uniref:Uncharacterized protein n=1 Tax=Aldrovandia affinis TaxID=143900 RepID=A0AAD7X3R7_9TELE|nr:hypothetical protein AAFF_G00138480 [Aldrovandia affinis]
MIALMKFTKDICRLLGYGIDIPGRQQRQEYMEYGGTSSDQNEDVIRSQDVLSGEEGLSEEERAKRRTERRRARRKRQRDRKQLEKVKKGEGSEQDGEDEEGGAESELEDSESDEEEEEEEKEHGREEEEEKEQVILCSKDRTVPPLASSGSWGNRQPLPSYCEEEPEWDVSSAFVANAASHIRPKSRTRPGSRSKGNEGRTTEVNGTETIAKRSTSLTEKGIKLVQQGQYGQAVGMFTEAIRYDPNDYRFFGNRSYCYECLEQYSSALSDAERSIQLASEWPKGYFRQGRALMGMKRYSEAEKAMEMVLKLDNDCEEAVNELFHCRVLQLMELGFEETESMLLLEKHNTVQAVLDSTEAVEVMNLGSTQDQGGPPCVSLWVGNVTTELTEKHLEDLFKTFGEIESIRVLHKRFCAFINFKNANMAARALEKLHGVEIENTRLVIRYPDRQTQSRRRGVVHGDECYFWRTTGCHFGEKCRYKHILEQRGCDQKPWKS